MGGSSAERPAGWLVGQVVEDRFQVQRLLGSGAMGEVYLAQQLSLGMPRALKVIRADVTDPAHEGSRFRREAMALSRLLHPNIVQVIDFGNLDGSDALHYLVLEHVQGVDAYQAVVRGGPLPVAYAVSVLRQLAAALDHAHQQGIVHRDLKPSNILLQGDGPPFFAAPVVKVVDFGMVRIVTDEVLTKITAEEQLVGTPQFMAPEQCRSSRVGPPADIYALGGVGFYLLTGMPVFEGTSVIDLLSAHLSRPPELLSHRCPGLDLPLELEELVHHCLGKDPAQRPTAAEALEVLERMEQGPLSVDSGPGPSVGAADAGQLGDEPSVSHHHRSGESDTINVASLIWCSGETEESSPVREALHNQLSTLLLNLARLAVDLVDEPDALARRCRALDDVEVRLGELELDWALASDQQVGADGGGAGERLRAQMVQLGGQRDDAFRRLFQTVLGLRAQLLRTEAAPLMEDLEHLLEQYLRLGYARGDSGEQP